MTKVSVSSNYKPPTLFEDIREGGWFTWSNTLYLKLKGKLEKDVTNSVEIITGDASTFSSGDAVTPVEKVDIEYKL